MFAFNALFGTVPLLLDEASVQIAERIQTWKGDQKTPDYLWVGPIG